MSLSHQKTFSPAEAGALALDEAARALDRADSAAAFLGALDCNRRVWQGVGLLGVARAWSVPDADMVAYALRITDPSQGVVGRDDHVQALIDINQRVSFHLAGGDIEALRARARALWEAEGDAAATDPSGWLIANFEGWAD